MAREAAFTDDLWRLVPENEDLGFVAAAVDMLGSRAVARFAAVGLASLLGFQKAVPVPSLLKTIKKIFVAGFARVGPNVWRGSWLLIGSRFGRLIIGAGSGACNEQCYDRNPERKLV